MAGGPHLQEVAVLVEDLHAAVLAIGDEESAVIAESDAVHRPELVRTGVGRVDRLAAPVHDEVAVGVELGHARTGITVGDEERAVGKPNDVGRTVEVVRAAAGNAPLADRLYQLAIVREDADVVLVVVDDPDVLLRIVRILQYLVRPTAHFAEPRSARRREVRVVLEPLLDGVAFPIHGEHNVMSPHVIVVRVSGVGAPARVRAPRFEKTGADPRRGAGRQFDLAALRHPDFVRTLGEDPRARPPGPTVVREIIVRQRFRPVQDDLVVAHVHGLYRLRRRHRGCRRRHGRWRGCRRHRLGLLRNVAATQA